MGFGTIGQISARNAFKSSAWHANTPVEPSPVVAGEIARVLLPREQAPIHSRIIARQTRCIADRAVVAARVKKSGSACQKAADRALHPQGDEAACILAVQF